MCSRHLCTFQSTTDAHTYTQTHRGLEWAQIRMPDREKESEYSSQCFIKSMREIFNELPWRCSTVRIAFYSLNQEKLFLSHENGNEKVNSTCTRTATAPTARATVTTNKTDEREREEVKKDAAKLHKCFKLDYCKSIHLQLSLILSSRRSQASLQFSGLFSTTYDSFSARILSCHQCARNFSFSLYLLFSRAFASLSLSILISLCFPYSLLHSSTCRHWRKLNMNNSWCSLHVGYNSNIKRKGCTLKLPTFVCFKGPMICQWNGMWKGEIKNEKKKHKNQEWKIHRDVRCVTVPFVFIMQTL